MKENLKLGAILLVITAIAGALLGFAYDITRGPVAERQKQEQAEALKVVLPADEFAELSGLTAKENVSTVFEAKSGGNTAGYVIEVETKGYGGPISMMVGISPEDKVTGIKVLKQNETPGLGSKTAEPAFTDQYKDKDATKDLSLGSDITAITGVTISSKAVTAGVNTAIQYYNEELKGGK